MPCSVPTVPAGDQLGAASAFTSMKAEESDRSPQAGSPGHRLQPISDQSTCWVEDDGKGRQSRVPTGAGPEQPGGPLRTVQLDRPSWM